jgi:hypothetical protein
VFLLHGFISKGIRKITDIPSFGKPLYSNREPDTVPLMSADLCIQYVSKCDSYSYSRAKSRDTSGCSDGLRSGRPGFHFRQEKKFSILHSVKTALEPTQPSV